MNLYTLLRKGESHPVYCEDFAITYQDDRQIVMAVFDGCSSGRESAFASALLGKLIRQNAHHSSLKQLFENAFLNFKLTMDLLTLQEDELLATALVAHYDKQKEVCEVVVLGDGYIVLDDNVIEIDQKNMPDYWAYHLQEDFESWWKNQHIYKIDHPKRVALSTDGIDTFRTNQEDLPEGFSPLQYLIFDSQWKDLPAMLNRKAIVLEKKYGFLPYDDVGIAMLLC